MKTDLQTTSHLPPKALNKDLSSRKAGPGVLTKEEKGSSPDYKVDLSSKVPPLPVPSVSAPSVPTLTEPPVKSEIKDTLKEDALKKAEPLKKPEAKEGSVKRAAIFFVKGLDVFSSPSKSEGGYAGVGKMAESIEGSRIYGWDQKEEMIKEIKKVHRDYPVILVGHSLGGDTAVEIAEELDSLKEGFRAIDLLVTVDAIGFSHDIIPQNVKNHLNVFGEKSFLLHDGPHVARREEKTEVRNILSPLDHTDLDDDREIQYEIVSLIQNTLSKKL